MMYKIILFPMTSSFWKKIIIIIQMQAKMHAITPTRINFLKLDFHVFTSSLKRRDVGKSQLWDYTFHIFLSMQNGQSEKLSLILNIY